MSSYAVVVALGLAALAARGFGLTAVGIAVGVLLVGAGFDVTYRTRRREDRVLSHRRTLDWIVRRQWLGIAVFGSGVGAALQSVDAAPLQHAPPVVQALTVGLVVAATTIYVSSLIDWYWVLPKISGMVGLAPCERTGGERFAGVTKIWFFHRATATTIVTFVLAGVPGYMAGSTGGHSAVSTGWVVLGSALAIGYNSVNTGLTAAFRYAFNPRFHVGDIIRVRADPEDSTMQDAYVADVSIQGLKYKLPPDESEATPKFADKGLLLPMDAIGRTNRARQPQAPCKDIEHCRAVNWYCFRNPNASTIADSDESPPVPYVDPHRRSGPQEGSSTSVHS
jgi:hypothetical protein